MLIEMMKIYQQKHKISNIIVHNFIHKSIEYFHEFKEPFTLKTIKRPVPQKLSFQRKGKVIAKQLNGEIISDLF